MSEDIDFLHPPKDTDDKDKDRKKSPDFISFHIPEDEDDKGEGIIDKVKSYFRGLFNRQGKQRIRGHKVSKKRKDNTISKSAPKKKDVVKQETNLDKQKDVSKSETLDVGGTDNSKENGVFRSENKLHVSSMAESDDRHDIEIDVNLAPSDNTRVNIGLYIRILLVVLVVVITGIFSYKSISDYQSEKENINTIKSRISKIEREVNDLISSRDVRNKLDFYIRKDLFVTTYSNITRTSRLFDVLEGIVTDGVVFQGFSFNADEGSLVVKAVAESYEKAVWQWYLFKKSDYVKSVKVSEISKGNDQRAGDKEGAPAVSILFDILLDMDKFKINSD